MTSLKHSVSLAFFFFTVFCMNNTQAQINDPGFENWDSTDQETFRSYMPSGWGEFINQSCESEGKPWAVTRVNDARSGSSALQLKNIALSSFSAATTVMSKSGSEFNNKIPVNKRHTKLEGYYKYDSPGNDTFKVSVIMMKGDEFIGFGEYRQSIKTSSYTKFSVPVMYVTPATDIPDSAIIIFSAGSEDTFVEGSTLILDDVNFATASGINDPVNSLQAEINIWPNPAKEMINLNISGSLKGNVSVEVVNLLGETLKTIRFNANDHNGQLNVLLSDLPKGILFVQVGDANGRKAMRVIHE